MNRRNFCSTVAVAGACAALSEQLRGQQIEPNTPSGFSNPKVAIGRGVYAEPKWLKQKGKPENSKVPGTMVSLTIARPPNVNPFFVTVFIQYFGSDKQWHDVPCHPDYTDWYSFKGSLRDIHTFSDDYLKATLFVPDAAHFLAAGGQFSIRPEIRFWTTNNQLLDGLSQPLPSEVVTPTAIQKSKTVEFQRGDTNPPFEIFNLITHQTIPI